MVSAGLLNVFGAHLHCRFCSGGLYRSCPVHHDYRVMCAV